MAATLQKPIEIQLSKGRRILFDKHGEQWRVVLYRPPLRFCRPPERGEQRITAIRKELAWAISEAMGLEVPNNVVNETLTYIEVMNFEQRFQ